MSLVFITVGVRKPLSANKPLTCYTSVEGYAEAAGRGLGLVWRSRPSALNTGEGLVCLASTTCSRAQKIGAYQSHCRTAS